MVFQGDMLGSRSELWAFGYLDATAVIFPYGAEELRFCFLYRQEFLNLLHKIEKRKYFSHGLA